MKTGILIAAITGFLLSACSSTFQQNMPVNHMYNSSQAGKYTSNGEQVYFTAIDQQGNRVSYTGGPNFGGMMMGGNLTCAVCHGTDGHGGTHYIHMQAIDAPAINYSGLIEMKKEDSGGNPTDYSLDDFHGVVIEGHDTAGDELDRDMPRWQMNDQDLADLLDFLKTLP